MRASPPAAPRRLLTLVLLILGTAVTGCRSIAVSSEPSPTYSIDVHNELNVAMIVSYNDGRGDAVLGTVPANRSERFIIAAPATTVVTVRAVDESRSRSAGPITVRLVAGVPQPVPLR